MSASRPPLSVHIIWHPSDNHVCSKILKTVSTNLSRDIERPFSRNLNIPIFFYSTNSPDNIPEGFPEELAERNIVFVFTSLHTRGHDSWNTYIKKIPATNTMRIVPIALTHEGLDHGQEGSLQNLNFIRAYEWSKDSISQYALLFMAHEIYRHGFIEIKASDTGKSSSIKIFLSHAKSGDTGRVLAESIKYFIDNTNMSHFFDATEISPGFMFNEEIINHINESTIVSISSDYYSSKYWCQREILCAKQNDRPMIAVDCLEEYEDRIFPAASNIPCIHVSPEVPPKESDILRILTSAILETIRFHHACKSLKYYQAEKWISGDCILYSRPPEFHQILKSYVNEGPKDICYPEPPIYSEESDLHHQLNINTFTPLWNKTENLLFKSFRIGLSISDVPNRSFSNNHVPETQITRLAQDFARHVLARSGILIYGGDLRKNGFTEFILNEAIALKNRLKTDEINVENWLAWPIHKTDAELIAWRARYKSVMKTVEIPVPDDITKEVDGDIFLPPSTPQNKYYWARSLTDMRMKSIASSHARICAGGRLSGYNGKMPGVLEEILMTLEKNKPLYLLGAFGGVVGDVCKILGGEVYPESLTEEWQLGHSDGYVDLQEIAQSRGMHADYKLIRDIFTHANISVLSNRAGLTEDNYLRLMSTPFIDEGVYLILKGLKKLVS